MEIQRENENATYLYLQQALFRHLMGSHELVGHCGEYGMLGMVVVFNIIIHMIAKFKQINIT